MGVIKGLLSKILAVGFCMGVHAFSNLVDWFDSGIETLNPLHPIINPRPKTLKR